MLPFLRAKSLPFKSSHFPYSWMCKYIKAYSCKYTTSVHVCIYLPIYLGVYTYAYIQREGKRGVVYNFNKWELGCYFYCHWLKKKKSVTEL